MARAAFNWASLDRDQLIKIFCALRPSLVGQRIAITQAARLIKRHVRQHLPVSVTACRHAPVGQNELWIGGVYHSDYDRKKRKRFIEVQLAFAENDRKIEFNDYQFKRTARRFADLMLHEIIHCRQFRARRFKEIPGYQSDASWARERRRQEYYADPDEMGAYSFNIACELMDRFGSSTAKIQKYLNKTRRSATRTTSWQDYLIAFNWDHDHIKIREMKRKIMSQLERARLGRPFKNDNYLNY